MSQSQERGFIHFILILLILAVLVVSLTFYLLTRTQLSKYAPRSLKPFVSPTATSPKAVYANPLDKSSQYTNPFSDYKNPFDSLK